MQNSAKSLRKQQQSEAISENLPSEAPSTEANGRTFLGTCRTRDAHKDSRRSTVDEFQGREFAPLEAYEDHARMAPEDFEERSAQAPLKSTGKPKKGNRPKLQRNVGARTMEDFRWDELQEKYWDLTTGSLLGAKAVDSAILEENWPTRIDKKNGETVPYPPSLALRTADWGLTVRCSTWWPGKEQLLMNTFVNDKGVKVHPGAVCYNAYIAPDRSSLRADKTPDAWIGHVKKLFPVELEHEHFFDVCAHMIQKPQEKLNHGIILAGAQGIGKDTALLPVRSGVGDWNTAEIGPDAIAGPYNGYVKSVLLMINEVRPHDEDFKASNFYDMLKPLLAAPPDVIGMTVKYANTVYIRNLCRVVLTTNDPLTMYIPAEDRRLFVMTSTLADPKVSPVFPEGYFESLRGYLEDGGTDAVIRWLLARDISKFKASAPPPMTQGKQAIIDSAHQVRRTFVDDIFEAYIDHFYPGRKPDVLFSLDLIKFVEGNSQFEEPLKALNLIKAKNFHFKMAERGYDMLRNQDSTEWSNGIFRTRMAFVRRDIPQGERLRLIKKELENRPRRFD